jgi:hypothetical protein
MDEGRVYQIFVDIANNLLGLFICKLCNAVVDICLPTLVMDDLHVSFFQLVRKYSVVLCEGLKRSLMNMLIFIEEEKKRGYASYMCI